MQSFGGVDRFARIVSKSPLGSFGCAPSADLLPQPPEWPLFARKQPLYGVVEPGGYKALQAGNTAPASRGKAA